MVRDGTHTHTHNIFIFDNSTGSQIIFIFVPVLLNTMPLAFEGNPNFNIFRKDYGTIQMSGNDFYGFWYQYRSPL